MNIETALRAALEVGPVRVPDVAHRLGLTPKRVYMGMVALRRRGEARRIGARASAWWARPTYHGPVPAVPRRLSPRTMVCEPPPSRPNQGQSWWATMARDGVQDALRQRWGHD